MHQLVQFVLILFTVKCVICARRSQTTKRLYKQLLSGYDENFRPDEGGNATTVHFDVMLNDVLNVDEGTLQAVMKANVWVTMQWKDKRLSWELSQNPARSIVISSSKIWKPDIRLYNSLDPKIRMDDKVKMTVHHDGRILHVIPMLLIIHCDRPRTHGNATWECAFRFGSWAYHAFQLDIYIRNDGVDLSAYTNKVWEITGNESARRAITRKCCREQWPEATFTIRINRR